MLYVIGLAPPDCVTVLCRQRKYYVKTVTLSLHITQLDVPLLASTNIHFFSSFIKQLTIRIHFSFLAVIKTVQYYNTA